MARGATASAGRPRVGRALLARAAADVLGSPHTNVIGAREARAEVAEIAALAEEGRGDPVERFTALLGRRLRGEPVALLRGHVVFCGLRMRVAAGTFAPRPSSEDLVTAALRRLRSRSAPIHLDLATGIGPVALAVAAALPRAEVHGVDISSAQLAQARRNRRALGLGRVRFHRGDLLGAAPGRLRGRVSVITMHPPYVPRRDLRRLPAELRAFEPAEALNDGSSDGLGLVRRLAGAATTWLAPGGWVLLEVAPDLAAPVRRVLRGGGLVDAVTVVGTGPSRIVGARRSRG